MKLSVIFSNIIGFDGLIFLLALLNIYIYLSAKRAAEVLYTSMHHSIYSPSFDKDYNSIKQNIEELTDQKLASLRENAVSKYTLFINLTAIFPLMGILGTVISLLGMVGDTSDIQGGFFAALTSTFWGLIFAIIFKFVDGFISPKLEDGERSVELLMQRRGETTAPAAFPAPEPQNIQSAPASPIDPAKVEEENYARGLLDSIEPFEIKRRKKK